MKTLVSCCASITRPARSRTVSGAVAVGILAISMLGTAARAAVPPIARPPAPNLQAAANSTNMPDIRDIRPPFHIESRWFWWTAAAGCCALGASAGGWYWWRRGRLAAKQTAAELALEQLKKARVLLAPGQARAFSIAVSGVIRTYIEQRFDIAATQQTTREFLQDCVGRSAGSLAAHRQSLEDFLQYCDLAKFARWMPSSSEMEALLDSAIAFVNATVARDASPISDRSEPAAPPYQQVAVFNEEASQP